MINQEYKDTYSLVVINWFRKDWEYLISQYSRISASLYSCFPPTQSNQPHLFTRTQLLFDTGDYSNIHKCMR